MYSSPFDIGGYIPTKSSLCTPALFNALTKTAKYWDFIISNFFITINLSSGDGT